MPADIPADVAYIGGVWAEAVLYGFHIILFGTIIKVLSSRSYRRGREVSSLILLGFSACMFILSTAHAALALYELLQGLVYYRDFPGGPSVFFRINVFPQRKAIYLINTVLGDSLLVWRVYVIWGHNPIICIPSVLLLVGTTICAIKTIVANATTPASSVFTSDILSWVTSTFVLTIATQITATSLIAGRIYYVSHATGVGLSKSRYMPVVWIIVESGAVYTSAALVQLVTYLLHMNAGVILELMLSQISAMAPALIVVRVALGFAYDGTPSTKKADKRGGGDVVSTFQARVDSHVRTSSDNVADASLTLGDGVVASLSSSSAGKRERSGFQAEV